MKIVSDGTLKGTGVYDDAGNLITGVVYLKWEANTVNERIGTVTMQVIRVPIDLTGIVMEEKEITLGTRSEISPE